MKTIKFSSKELAVLLEALTNAYHYQEGIIDSYHTGLQPWERTKECTKVAEKALKQQRVYTELVARLVEPIIKEK